MTAIGIDVSKGKSMMAGVSCNKVVVIEPIEFSHTEEALNRIVEQIRTINDETRVVLEATGHYHEAVVAHFIKNDIYVSVVNPLLVHDYGNNTVRRIKTDRKDAIKIARYGLDNWAELREYIPQDMVRQQLKMFSRQYNLSMKTIRALENNLISLLDKTFPGLNKLFVSRKRKDGRQKWLDFSQTYWHVATITQMPESDFIADYKTWCIKMGYQFKETKACEIYAYCQKQKPIITLPFNTINSLLITTAVEQILHMSRGLAIIKDEMIHLATLLPEHETVISLYGVGALTAAQLIAEIGDVRRFHKRGSLTAYAGIDPLPQQSGKYEKKSTKTSKRGSASLRKTLFQVICTYLRRAPEHESIFHFIDKKRAEGKPYFVYMTAAANKFLRIYYARVKAGLETTG